MSKTIRLQVEKSRSLIKGLRKHLNEGGSGISSQQIASMEQTVAELLAVCEQCERMRADILPVVKRTHELMNDVKADYSNNKQVIRNNYPKEIWIKYGLTDKR